MAPSTTDAMDEASKVAMPSEISLLVVETLNAEHIELF